MIDELITAAQTVRAHAYAPYSGYQVGAAVLGENGKIYAGCNVENASYGLTICAERNAIGQMVADGCTTLSAVVVVTANGGSPCGACRQVLSEFGDVAVYLVAGNKTIEKTTVSALLPLAFASKSLHSANSSS